MWLNKIKIKFYLGGVVMNKIELNVIELLEYLQEILENAPKVPITGKAMIDTKEFEEVIDQISKLLA